MTAKNDKEKSKGSQNRRQKEMKQERKLTLRQNLRN